MIFLISPGLGEEVKEEVACNEREEGDENWEEDVHCAGNLLVRYLGHSSSLKHMERLSSMSVSIQVPTWDILVESLLHIIFRVTYFALAFYPLHYAYMCGYYNVDGDGILAGPETAKVL